MPSYARLTETRPSETHAPEVKSPEQRAAEALAARGGHTEPRGLEWAEAGGGPLRRRPAGAATTSTSTSFPGPGQGPGREPDRETAESVGPAESAEAADPERNVIPMPQLVRDSVLLVARVVLGVILVAHGLQKVVQGVSATAEGFGAMGIPLPEAVAVLTMAVELGGGALLILGLLTPIAGLLAAVILAGAIVFAHLGNGIFAADGGWELAAGLGVGALVLAVVGPGRFSLDQLLVRRR
ncbi:MAG: DoxX family protein [Citricoccus sp.]